MAKDLSGERRWIAIALAGLLLVCGFALRLHFVKTQSCYWRAPESYISIASNLFDEKGFLDEASNFGVADRTRRPPLIPAILAGLMILFGAKAKGIGIFLVLQALASTLVALITALWARFVTNNRGVFWFMLVVGIIWAPAMGLVPCVMTEVYFQFFFVVACLLLTIGFAKGGYSYFFFAAISLGLASLARPILYPLYPLLAVGWVWLFHKRPGLTRQKKLISAACFFATLILVIAPWMIRNSKITGSPTLITTSVGLNLLMQNTDKEQQQMWKQLHEQAAPGGQLSGMDENQRDRELAGRAWEAIRHHPGRFLARALDRTLLIYHNSNHNYPDHPYNFKWAAKWSIIMALGLVLLFLGRFHQGLFLAMVELNFILVYSLTFFEARFREMVMPAHLVLFSVGALWLISQLRSLIRKRQSASGH